MLLIKRVLETHKAQTYRTMAHVGYFGLGYRVVVDVDHVIQHTDRRAHGLLQFFQIESILVNMPG